MLGETEDGAATLESTLQTLKTLDTELTHDPAFHSQVCTQKK